MFNGHPPIDVERQFAAFVRSFGARVLEDQLGTAVPFRNADYFFPTHNVIGELKRIVADTSDDARLQAKIQEKFEGWMADGTIGLAYGEVRIDSRQLPMRCQRELMDLFRPAIRRRIDDANKQIRSTRDALARPDAQGLLFLVNDGNYDLEADAARYLIGRALGDSYSAINSVVYLTVNMPASSPSTADDVLVWMHLHRRSQRPSVDVDFVNALFRGWREFLQGLVRSPIAEIPAGRSDLEHIRLRKQTL